MKHKILITYDDVTKAVTIEYEHKRLKKDDLLTVLRSAAPHVEACYATKKLPARTPRKSELKEGDPVVATYGYNDVLKKPFEFLYEFGYYTKYGCVVYRRGERNMQDSYAFKMKQIRVATKEDLDNKYWGD